MAPINGTVLIADDEDQIRNLCVSFLQRFGYETISARNGVEALELASDRVPDIVLIDVMMPRMTGLEVCRELKARHSTQHLPVVLMTGMDQPEDVVNGLQSGADDYVCKPLRLPELHLRLSNLIRRKQMFDMLHDHNEEMIETLGSQSRTLTELFTLSLQMNKSQHLDELLSVLTNSLSRMMDCRRVSVLMFNRSIRRWNIVASLGIPQDVATQISLSEDSPILRDMSAGGQPAIIDPTNAMAVELYGANGAMAFSELPVMLVPLSFSNELLGVITLTDRTWAEPGHFAPTDITVLTYVAQVAGIAIKNRLRQEQIRETQDVTIFALARLAESRDELTGNHLRRVQTYCRRLAESLRLSGHHQKALVPEFISELWRAAPMHDIGKVGISDNILLKPGRLTPEERKEMEQHTVIGGQTLEAAESLLHHDSFLSMAKDICYFHHEKWDGSGYPFGYSGEEIPLSARITACADVYDALTSARPYKPAFSHERAVGIIAEGRGTHFDPTICDVFLTLADEFNKIRLELQDNDVNAQAVETTFAQ
ncbi:Cyclic di-GMP phosphodiesterase response regulator RpfG [Planctomycetes bacterium Pan216]|uniref:Cyclic di-GMP phosphodiesterase response regulator RpfG n=1 Tax=Kolteria novifilia TaxID=2527975 RepID=A0A518AZ92_9BACT|nr:Cyclic di-GMP phosphodiesterase response regulator RpfG [Planctomycetes bacterium Pan216]